MSRMRAGTTAAVAAITLWAGMASVASAQLIANDPFLSGDNRGAGEYTAGNDMRTMGAAALGWVGTSGIDGFGVAHAGNTGNFVANATGENAAAVDYEAGGRMQWIGVGNFPSARNITRQLNPTPASGEWWFSIMTNRLGWADVQTNTFAVGGFTNAAGNGLQIGYDDTAGAAPANNIPDLVLRTNGTNIVLEADVPSSSNRFVIVQMLVDTAGNETLNVWVNPASADVPNLAPTATITDQDITSSLTPFTQSKYESPGQSGVVYWDEIRLGLDAASIGVPEPASLALLGVGGLALLRRRRA